MGNQMKLLYLAPYPEWCGALLCSYIHSIKLKHMNLSLKELNELIYCVGSVIADKTNTYNSEDRQLLFNKLYSELEDRVSAIEAISVTDEDYNMMTDYPGYGSDETND
jgi:hypothetical protein